MLQYILLIQDDPAGAQVVRDALTHSSDGPIHIEWVRTCSAGLERILAASKKDAAAAPALTAVLVDLLLPDCQGIEAFNQLFGAAPELPILVLSGSQDEETARLAVQRGAQDYVLKSRIDDYVLPKALRSMRERAANAEALFEEKERAQVTLNSIGDAVVSTDVHGLVTYLNAVAEGMTGWSCEEATGHAVEEVLRIIDVDTREPVSNPMVLTIREDKPVALTANCVLLRRDGSETDIEDSAAPIHDRRGQVTGAVMVFHDVSIARAMSVKMSHLAQHDSLTDLPNRVLLDDRLICAMATAHRHQQKLAVLFLDLDRFKYINDSMGHGIGDRLLQSVTQRLLACVRSADTVSRQGGDEFVILLSELTQAQDADVCAEKILSALSMPHAIDQHSLYVTASIGIAIYPDDGADAGTLFKHADSAMYQAKANGRNGFQFFRSDMNTQVVDRHLLEGGLRQAMEQDQFILHYQPILNLETGSIVAVEALLRWRHPQRGLLAPADFLSLAEDCGIIVSIGNWALREACRQAVAWRNDGLSAVRIAVNVSAAELNHRGFVTSVNTILAQSGLESRYLELELTETFLVLDSESTVTVLYALKDMGVQLALDDFGTGYSSLNHLRRFPIDALKIDQSFVRNLPSDADDGTIVGAVIGMAMGLQMRVVAEGVETAEQLAFLAGHRCPEVQGFYLHRPGIAHDVGRLMAQEAARPGNVKERSVTRQRISQQS